MRRWEKKKKCKEGKEATIKRRHKKTEERKRGVKINVLGRNRKPET